MNLIVTTPEELRSIIFATVQEAIKTQHEQQNDILFNQKIMSINQVAKRLGRKHATIKRLVVTGAIKATSDGRITEDNLSIYLKQQTRN